jgi:hypothetical protein
MLAVHKKQSLLTGSADDKDRAALIIAQFRGGLGHHAAGATSDRRPSSAQAARLVSPITRSDQNWKPSRYGTILR